MSAFVAILSCDQKVVSERGFDPVMAALDHRGPDGKDTIGLGWASIGHQHFWTTPEEVGERQPASDAATGLYVLLDGRFDNRDELGQSLQIDPRDLARLSDAALLLRAFERWGESCIERLLGPFAFVAVDSKARRVVCARDALGDRTLFYYADAETLAIASEECALLAHPSVSSRLDETTVARYYAVEAPLTGATFFADIHELPAAHGMAVEADRPNHIRMWRHWHLDSLDRLLLRSDREYIERFRDVLTESVRCRLRCPSPPAVLMSGGLDSTPVAALAAQELRSTGSKQPLSAISWVFDELSTCDEKDYIRPVVEQSGLNSILIPGDDTWPLSDLSTWPVNPNTPLQNLYRRLISRAYSEAREAGASTVLTGADGDWLYSADQYWLRDLLFDRRFGEASKLFAGELIYRTSTLRGRSPRLTSVVGRALGRKPRGPRTPAWLTPYAHEQLGNDSTPTSSGPMGRPEQARQLVGAAAAYGTSQEVSNAGRASVEVRRPFRDRRLVELVLALPANLLYRGGWRKWIMRSAMVGILPEAVRLRWQGTSLIQLCAKGLIEKEADVARNFLSPKQSMWPRFVRPEWMRNFVPHWLREDSTEALVPWHCICMELWIHKLGESL